MAKHSICSMHRIPDPNCDLCNTYGEDVIPHYKEKEAEAERAGKEICAKCGFEFYKTTDACPLCRNKWAKKIHTK